MPHDTDAVVDGGAVPDQTEATHQEGWLPSDPPRRPFESVFVRIVATVGVLAIGTVLGALLVANNVSGWIVGLTVSVVSVVLAAVLWRTPRAVIRGADIPEGPQP